MWLAEFKPSRVVARKSWRQLHGDIFVDTKLIRPLEEEQRKAESVSAVMMRGEVHPTE